VACEVVESVWKAARWGCPTDERVLIIYIYQSKPYRGSRSIEGNAMILNIHKDMADCGLDGDSELIRVLVRI